MATLDERQAHVSALLSSYMTCIRVLQGLVASRLCLERDWWDCECTTHDGGRVTTRPIVRIQEEGLTF